MKEISRRYANHAQRWGELVPQPCADCGADKSEKHHEDYSKPFEIVWLCRKCHRKRHWQASKENFRGPEPIKKLLRVGVSKPAIARYLGIHPVIVASVCRGWKQTELPKILQMRRG